MQVRRTPQFDDERDRYSLRASCEDCAHFDAALDRCRHFWPTETHRRRALDARPTIEAMIDFCKEFELC